MKSISEKEKKLLETLDKLKNIDIIKPDKIIELDKVLFSSLKNLSFVDLGESIYYYRYIYEFN